jgi:hypothetical protein
MKFALLLTLLLSSSAYASFGEMFGSSYSTAAIGGQSNMDENDPSNNFYAPAVLGFSDKFNVMLQASSTATHFDSIDNVVIKNSTNSNTTESGSVKTDYKKFYGGALHVALPLGATSHLGTLGLSVFLPIGSLMETHSGDPALPEYVMYRSRYDRTSIYFNFAKAAIDNDLAFSIGTILGFQASADVRTNVSLNGANYGSTALAQSKISPALGIIASGVKKIYASKIYLTYQQEMKSNLTAIASGEISDPLPLPFNATVSSMIFYDPHTFRLGTSIKSDSTSSLETYVGLEYQIWSGYKTPKIDIVKNGGILLPSTNYEKIERKNTLNPKIGIKWDVTNRLALLLGAAYRMTPLKGDFSGSGNSIDTDSYIASGGLQYRIVIWGRDVSIGTSLQYHQLKDKHVTKTTGQENGNAGDKIGAPGYDIGGYILSAAAGIKFNF